MFHLELIADFRIISFVGNISIQQIKDRLRLVY